MDSWFCCYLLSTRGFPGTPAVYEPCSCSKTAHLLTFLKLAVLTLLILTSRRFSLPAERCCLCCIRSHKPKQRITVCVYFFYVYCLLSSIHNARTVPQIKLGEALIPVLSCLSKARGPSKEMYFGDKILAMRGSALGDPESWALAQGRSLSSTGQGEPKARG